MSLNAFRADIAKETPENPNGIPEQAIRPIGTLHLTLGVMSLLTRSRVQEALTVLKSLNLRDLLAETSNASGDAKPLVKNKSTSGKGEKGEVEVEPLTITLRGLESMHTSSKTSVLYTSPVDTDKRLYSFCNSVKAVFVDADLLVRDERPLLLHATLVNTVYVPGVRGKGSGHGRSSVRLTIDAREFLRAYEGKEWMRAVRVETVAVCRMGAVKGENGEEYYGVEGEVEMPV
jgi:activating signal cointegrator complex subunit 1